MDAEGRGDDWNKKFLEALLYSNSDRLVIKSNDKGKNPFIWSQFKIAYIDGVEQKYACCKFCKTFIKYTGRTGTGGLMRHLCFRKLNQGAGGPRKMRAKVRGTEDEDFVDDGEDDRDRGRCAKGSVVRMRLEGLVYRNSPRVGYIRNAKGKSYIWSQFRIVTVDNVLTKFACCILCRSIVTYTGRTGTGGMTRHKCRSNKYAQGLDESGEQLVVAASDADPDGVVIKSEKSFDWDEKESSGDERVSSEQCDDMTRTPLRLVESDYKTEADEQEGGMVATVAEGGRTGLPPEVERILQQKHAAVLNKSLQLFDVFENDEFLELAQFLVNLGARYGPMDVKNVFKGKMNLVTLNGD